MFASSARLFVVSYVVSGTVTMLLLVLGLGFPMAATFGFLSGMTAAGIVERQAQLRFARKFYEDLEARALTPLDEIKF